LNALAYAVRYSNCGILPETMTLLLDHGAKIILKGLVKPRTSYSFTTEQLISISSITQAIDNFDIRSNLTACKILLEYATIPDLCNYKGKKLLSVIRISEIKEIFETKLN